MKSHMNAQKVIDQPTNNNHDSLAPQERCQPSAQPKRHCSVSLKELQQLLAGAGNDQVAIDLKQIATIVFYTGIRPGELKKLAWADIDLEKRRMRVDSKSGRLRTVPFGRRVRQIFVDRAKSGTGSDFVLGKSPSATLHRISRRLRELPCMADGAKLTLHGLRDSFALHWMNAGGDLVGLAAMMGFSNFLSTKIFLSKDQEEAVAARIQAQFEDQDPV